MEQKLGGGFKYVLFSPLLGEDSHFDINIFQMGWNHQLENVQYTVYTPKITLAHFRLALFP